MRVLFTGDDLRRALGVSCPAQLEVTEVSIDSREAGRGKLFVALPGTATDGHAFVKAALKGGASAALVKSEWANSPEGKATAAEGVVIAVADPLRGLQDLAAFHRARFPELEVLGLTGSNGKTTTKEILASITSRDRRVLANEGNLNSEIGLPLTVFRIRGDEDLVILEMGINHPGEMADLTRIAKPRYGIITNIGTAHIGLLGSREAIAREKGGLFASLSTDGWALAPENSDFLPLLTELATAPVKTFGGGSMTAFEGARPLGLEGTEIRYAGRVASLPLAGSHNVANALAAIRAAELLGVEADIIAAGLEHTPAMFGRGEILRGPITVIRDCYNANGDSMARSLETLIDLPWKGRKIAVLGAMKELGAEAESAHRAIGRETNWGAVDQLFAFGDEARWIWDEAARKGAAGGFFDVFDSLSRRVAEEVRDGDLVLLKGSRSLELERLVPVLGIKEGKVDV